PHQAHSRPPLSATELRQAGTVSPTCRTKGALLCGHSSEPFFPRSGLQDVPASLYPPPPKIAEDLRCSGVPTNRLTNTIGKIFSIFRKRLEKFMLADVVHFPP